MDITTMVVLEVSDELRELLDQQGVDLPYAIQEELQEVELTDITDPESLSGTKDITTALLVTAEILGALSPAIEIVLKHLISENTKVHTKEKSISSVGSKPEYIRIFIYTEEENQQTSIGGSGTPNKLESPESADTSKELPESDTNIQNEVQK